MNQEFESYPLNQQGRDKAVKIAEIFDTCLNELKQVCPEGRHLSILKTKLEEASFFAKKSMASHPENREGGQ